MNKSHFSIPRPRLRTSFDYNMQLTCASRNQIILLEKLHIGIIYHQVLRVIWNYLVTTSKTLLYENGSRIDFQHWTLFGITEIKPGPGSLTYFVMISNYFIASTIMLFANFKLKDHNLVLILIIMIIIRIQLGIPALCTIETVYIYICIYFEKLSYQAYSGYSSDKVQKL